MYIVPMVYGKNKARNMGRSLLPSTRSKGARDDKAAVKRTARHNIREELDKVALDPDYYDDANTDFEADTNHEIREVVHDRRNGDKTGPFERWSVAITKKVDQDSRLTYVKSILPKGVIGDHALTHIEWKDHFSTRAELELEKNIKLNREEGRTRNRYAKKKANRRLTRDEEVDTLRKIVEDGRLHRELNKFMSANVGRRFPAETVRERVFNEITQQWEIKYRSVYFDFPPGAKFGGIRKLLGMHDIETYYDDIRNGWKEPDLLVIDGIRYANPKAHKNGYSALVEFLEAVYHKKKLPHSVSLNHYY